MEIAGTYRFTAPQEAVWDVLFDLQALRTAIPGCETLEHDGGSGYRLVLATGIAAVRGRYQGWVRLGELEEGTAYGLSFEGEGTPGRLRGEATVRLTQDGPETLLTYAAEVRAQGGLARLGARQLEGAARLIAAQFFREVGRQAAERADP